ncbi:MAG: DUF4340 domain-containing protein [Treponema sp.]|nr:DUF4340 domain-containing protein [Treponema sp.]
MKKLIITSCIIFVLLVTYAASFFKTTDKRKKMNTALVNTKYLPSITEIDLSQNGEELRLIKQNEIWFLDAGSGTNPETNLELIPVEQKRVDNFLQELSKTRTAYKISDKIEKNNAYGLTDGSELVLRYYYSSSESYYELIFGNNDFSQTSRYFMTGKTAAVYEIDSSLNNYLSLSLQLWYDPYIISKALQKNLSYKDIQRIKVDYEGKPSVITTKADGFVDKVSKLIDLRHGGKTEYKSIGSPELTLTLEKGDKSEITISIFATENQSEYNVETIHSETGIKVNTKISLWTYNKIKEIML